MKNKIKLKINTNLDKFKKGQVIALDCDSDGLPFNHFWRRRLADAEIDNCVEIVKEAAKATPIKKGE
jgi:hypothetical protein